MQSNQMTCPQYEGRTGGKHYVTPKRDNKIERRPQSYKTTEWQLKI